MHPLEKKLLAHLRKTGLIRPGQKGLLLVSGGRDSMALLHLLHALREVLPLSLEVAGYDHGLRPEARQETAWVGEQAAALKLPFHQARTGHLAGLAAGVQAAAREWRRALTQDLLKKTGAHWAATGHQQDDHLETWLLKWLRGAHISHLRGLQANSPPYIRPLLPFRREELTAYLREKGVPWLDDPSNASGKYKRNRVRNELMPLLEALSGGGLAARLGELEAQSGMLEAWLGAALAARPPRQRRRPGSPWP